MLAEEWRATRCADACTCEWRELGKDAGFLSALMACTASACIYVRTYISSRGSGQLRGLFRRGRAAAAAAQAASCTHRTNWRNPSKDSSSPAHRVTESPSHRCATALTLWPSNNNGPWTVTRLLRSILLRTFLRLTFQPRITRRLANLTHFLYRFYYYLTIHTYICSFDSAIRLTLLLNNLIVIAYFELFALVLFTFRQQCGCPRVNRI